MDNNLNMGEKIDIVPGSSLKIIQNRNMFSYGIDAILLSSIVKVSEKHNVMDLGTGSGIIPLFLCSRQNFKKIYGVEIQNDVADMARRSVQLNGLDERIEILNMDLKDIPKKFSSGEFNVVTSNPPYMSGCLLSNTENRAISRHEIACSLEDVVKIASFLLKDKGKFYLVHRPSRLVDIFWYLRKYDLEPKTIQFVHPKANKPPNIVLITSMKDGKPELKFKEPIYVYGEDGKYTEEIYRIYGMDVSVLDE